MWRYLISYQLDEVYLSEFPETWDRVAKKMHAIAREKGFWDGPQNFGEKIALIHSELSEALEAKRSNASSEKLPGFSEVEEELADTVIRIMDLSSAYGYRVGEAIVVKAAHNTTRPRKHGKEF